MQIQNNQIQVQNKGQYGNDLILYVLPNEKISLSAIQSYQIKAESIIADYSTEAIINSLKYRYGLKFLGKQYSEITVLCIPAKQPKIVQNLKIQKYQNQDLPYLIKVPSAQQHNKQIQQNNKQGQIQTGKSNNKRKQNIKGFASGKRSAIVKWKNKLVRYKGCGNLLQGFPIQNNQLRGCHFYHTAKRELYMTSKINHILLKQISVQSANIPKFMYQFSTVETSKLGLKGELPLLGKYCCVFQTQGDRRVGTHLISPLEIIFLNLCNIEEIKWLDVFQANKRIDSKEPIQFLAIWLFLEPGQQFLQQFNKLEMNANFITLDSICVQNKTNERKNQFIQKVLKRLVKSEFQKQQISAYVINLQQNLKDLISIIVDKVGYQMGQVKRIFCQNGINWGYFNDHGNLWHCNAHLNNFIITPPQKNSQFLLPLDFDLAFSRQQFICIDLDVQVQHRYGKYDQDQFQNFLCSQYQAMEMSVSGIQVMNFKYSINTENQQLGPLSPLRMARISLRDSLLRAFRFGMKKNKSFKHQINKKWDDNIEAIKKLIKICLTLSQDFQT